MPQVIIHPHAGTIAVVVPIPGALPVDQVARKDVPAGVPYRIVDAAVLPSDSTFRDAWAADFSAPDGFGIGAEAWFAERTAQAAQAAQAAEAAAAAAQQPEQPEQEAE
jgi:hypothetical protein